MLFTERLSGYVFDIYCKGYDASETFDHIQYFLGVLENQFNIRVKGFECDNEIRRSYFT